MTLLARMRKRLAVRIVAAITAVIILLSAGYVYLQFLNTKNAAMEIITEDGMRIAKQYADQLDAVQYETFSKDPQENDLYWTIRQELDRFRIQIGAMYVYFVKIDEKQQPLMMVDGQPKNSDSASPINEVIDMSADAVTAVMKGENASSPLIENETYGTYVSSYAPIKNAGGKIIGVLGIDVEATVINRITANVLQKSIYFLMLMFAATLAGIGFIIFFIVRALRPLRVITSSAESMATGDLLQAGVILSSHVVKSEDEIGTAYKAMVKMSGELNEIVGSIVANIARTSDQLVSSTDRFTEDARYMLDMNKVVSKSIQQITEGARTQTQNVNESARSIEEIATGIGRVSESSMTVSDAAVSALEIAEAGKKTMLKMNGQVNTISSGAEEAIESVAVLKGYSQEIEGALTAITEFAEQTKLLALNAAIEAARAGEHGSGFAVVANEVRKLADASSSSVMSVAELLKNIELESQRIGEKMDDAAKEIREGVTLSLQAQQSFERVVDAFRFVTEQIQEVSAAAQQISAGSEEVAASVNGIASIAKEVSDETLRISDLTSDQLVKMQQIADASSELSEMTHEMREAVQQVKV